MKLKHLCLLLLAVVACAAAQSEDDIPVENDNQFPPDNISETEGNVLNESEDTVIDITTEPSDQPEDESTLSTIETVTPTTEAPNTSESNKTPVEDTQSTTQEDVEAAEDQITSDTTEESVDAFAVTEISTSEEPVNEDVTTETNTPLIEDVPSPELEVQEASEDLAGPVETFSTEPTVTQAEEVQMSTTEPDAAISEINTDGESIDADTTDFSAAVDQDQGEPIDVATTESSSQGEDVSFPTSANEIYVGTSNDSAIDQDQGEPINAATTESSSQGEDLPYPTSANETDVDVSNDSAIGVAKFSVLLDGDEQLPTTVDLKDKSEVGTSTESVHDVTTELSVPLTMDEQLLTDDLDVKEESTDIVSSIEPVVVSTTEAVTPLAVDEELPTTELEENDKPVVDVSDTTLDGSDIAKNNLQTTQTNEESLNDGATVTPVSPIDPSEISIRSNIDKNDLEAISPLTLAEPPKDVAPEEVDLPNETKADNKVEDVSVGATTSVNKAGGIDKSVIAVIVAGMVVVVAGITIKKNWKSIKNKFSSSPRPANDRTNHTNGIAPEEVPLQDKDNKNPSPV